MLGNARRHVSWSLLLGVVVVTSGCSSNEAPRHELMPPSGGAGGSAGADAGAMAGGAIMSGGAGASGGAQNLGGAGGANAGAAGNGGGGGMPCSLAPLMPSGATIDVTPPLKIADALAKAKPGDRLVLHAGTYTSESISKLSFTKHVFIEVAKGEDVTLPGLHFTTCDHIVLDGIHVDGVLELEGASDFLLRGVVLKGQGEDAALQFQGQHAAGANHDIVVEDSGISGGGRTVFILGKFAPSEAWNHHLAFRRTLFTCGSHNCFQISGGRDIDIVESAIQSTNTAGVLTAGATRVNMSRNAFIAKDSAAMQIATPGAEWDNYAGVENMISSKIVIANNLVSGFKTGVQLDAASDVAIVYNTFVDGVGVRFNHRIPHDQAQKVILDGNDNVRIWNNIMQQLVVGQGDKPPAFLSNNLIAGAGAGGENPIKGDPLLDNDYTPGPGSPALDSALVNAETPLVDNLGRPRGDKPDVGANEANSGPVAVCPAN
jgi:Right handed beta helix region